jgi:hypothetical protein
MADTETKSFSAPLNSTSGELSFRRGAANVTIQSDDALGELYTAEFTEMIPDVKVVGNSIEVTYRFSSMSDLLKGWWFKDRTSAKITLNRRIAWQIVFKGGLSHLRADLSDMNIQSVAVIGGASDIELTLPKTETALPVTVTGGASHITLIHPADVGVKLHIVGGAAKVELGEQYLGAMGGEIILQTPGYKESAGHIEFNVKGGVSDVHIKSAT